MPTDTTIALDPKGETRSEQARRAAHARWNKQYAGKVQADTAARTGLSPLPLGPVTHRAPDDGIRELHGVVAQPNGGLVRATEKETTIELRIWDGSKSAVRELCPAQARLFADQLYGLAARIDRRRGQRP